jgi:hypothetical protein
MLKLMRRIAFGAVVVTALGGCEPTNQGYTPEQPIKYSHAVHAGVMKIPCQYCHYTATRSRFAGIPPATICMNCHLQVQKDNPEVKKIITALETGEPIQWNRVHRVPDHVFFDHSVHVNSDVACQQCHGPVETMGRVTQWAPLTMGWCLECHRASDPSPSGTKRASPLTDCAVCHH